MAPFSMGSAVRDDPRRYRCLRDAPYTATGADPTLICVHTYTAVWPGRAQMMRSDDSCEMCLTKGLIIAPWFDGTRKFQGLMMGMMLGMMSLVHYVIAARGGTMISLREDIVMLNGEPVNKGSRAEGLLTSARMVQAIMDDYNTSTVHNWAYPDTHKWDAERNVEEFVAMIPTYASFGLNAVTIGMQGGSTQKCDRYAPTISAYRADGSLDGKWLGRLSSVLHATDAAGMVVVLNTFYYSQIVRLAGDSAVTFALEQTVAFLMHSGHRNVILDLANEYTCKPYPGVLRSEEGLSHTILWVQRLSNHTIPVGVMSCEDGPTPAVLATADLVLVEPPTQPRALGRFYSTLQANAAWRRRKIPIEAIENGVHPIDLNLSLAAHSGWGLSDVSGFQTPPVNWRLETPAKVATFAAIREATRPIPPQSTKPPQTTPRRPLPPNVAMPAPFPNATWPRELPRALGLSEECLDRFVARLAQLYGGNGSGVIVRHGQIAKAWGAPEVPVEQASAVKPIFTSLLVRALTSGHVQSVTQPLSTLGFGLRGKDVNMTWRDVANMISGYTRAEAPGDAWAYNDFGIELYKEALKAAYGHLPMQTIFDAAFAPLQFEDEPHFDERDRLYISPRDFARIAWLWLKNGTWGEGSSQTIILDPKNLSALMRPYVPSSTPRTRAPSASGDYLHIGSFGGSSDQSSHGPGYYGFAWWFNRRVGGGPRAWPPAPEDSFQCNGWWNARVALMLPSLDAVVVWATPQTHRGSTGEDFPQALQQLMRPLIASFGGSDAAPDSARLSTRDAQASPDGISTAVSLDGANTDLATEDKVREGVEASVAAVAVQSVPQSPLQRAEGRTFRECGAHLCKDGQPFTLRGGSLHYFRVHSTEWPHSLRALKEVALMQSRCTFRGFCSSQRMARFNWTPLGDMPPFYPNARALRC